jgi:glucosamine-6-phosphate deaminase
MKIRLFDSEDDIARVLARELAAGLRRQPALVLGLPTGRTPVPLYRELSRLSRLGRVDFSRARSFNLDEFVGIGPQHAASFRTFMTSHLFSHINLPLRQARVLNGAARDSAAECLRFERAIERAGGLDLLILGLGTNGHVGFNEPAPALVARTHRVVIERATRRAYARLFGNQLDRVPREALTMGMGTILGARRIVLMATGRRKASAVRAMIEGLITPRLPASFLQLHPNVEVVLDPAAASRLGGLRRAAQQSRER